MVIADRVGVYNMFVIAAHLLLLHAYVQKKQAAVSQNETASVKRFVQDFYDWYAPMEYDRVFKETHVNSQTEFLRSKRDLLKPELAQAFSKAVKAAKVYGPRASGMFSVGMDRDPFVGGPINPRTYSVRSVKRKGQVWQVEVHGDQAKVYEPRPIVVAIVEKSASNGQWMFANFYYDHSHWNLVDDLREWMPDVSFAKRLAKKHPRSGGLTPGQVRALKAERLHAAVPTYIPNGMYLSTFEFDPACEDGPAFYSLTYRSDHGAEFEVEMASEGIGDVIFYPDEQFDQKDFSSRTVRNPVFGEMQVESLDLPTERDFGVNWIDLGARKLPRYVCLTGRHLPVSEAVKIARGLRFLK